MLTFSNFSGGFVFFLLANLILIALIGVLILAFYRRRIRTLMRGGVGIVSEQFPERPGQIRLGFAIATPPRDKKNQLESPGIPWSVFGVELLGALFFALSAALFWLQISNTSVLPIRLLATTLCFMMPVLIVFSLLLGPYRSLQSVPLIIFIFLWVFLGAAIFISQPEDGLDILPKLFFQFITFLGGGSFILSLGLFNRSLRAIWPILLIIMLQCTMGIITQGIINSVFGDQALGVYLYVALWSGFGVWLAVVLAFLPGFILGLALSWFSIARLATWHQQWRVGDQALLHNSIWGAASVNLFLSFYVGAKPEGMIDAVEVLLISCLPFLAYLGITKIGYHFLHQRLRPTSGKPLLYLRVFGYSRRASRLADLLRARWRYRGSLRLIAARDLASRIITPVMLRAFLLRHLKGFFIETKSDLEERTASIGNRRDPDGSFRTEILFCNGGSWRETVRRLMTDSHGVVMGLRSFNRQNRGCIFELQALLDFVSVSRILLIVDSRPGLVQTDVAFLQEVMTEAWTHLAVTSPNHALLDPVLRLVDAASGDADAVVFIIKELEAL